MSYTELCSKKDRSQASLSRQIRFKTWKLAPISSDPKWERDENTCTQIFKL